MDILLIDPPYTSLKGVPTDIGYNVGLTSLAAYLRDGGIEAGILTGDLLTDLAYGDGWLDSSLETYAVKQEEYRSAVNDSGHAVWKKLADLTRQYHPAAVGISYLTPLKCSVERVAKTVKDVDADIRVIVGGPHPTLSDREVMGNPNIDFAVSGEGEIPLLSLAQELKKGSARWEKIPGILYRDAAREIRRNPGHDLIGNLDQLPFPARELVLNCDFNVYRGHCALTARGCPYTCSFCADKSMWMGKVRRRSIENVLKELRLMKETYDVDVVDFQDGTFTYDRRYLEAFCNALINEKLDIRWRCTARYDNVDGHLLRLMKEANCTGLYFGLESGSDRVLRAIDKKTSVAQIMRISDMVYDAGIPSVTSVLVGLPDETKEDIEDTLKLMRSIKTDMFDVNSYVPLPGSRLFDATPDEEKNGIDWGKVSYKSFDNHFSKHMAHGELNGYVREAYEIADARRHRD